MALTRVEKQCLRGFNKHWFNNRNRNINLSYNGKSIEDLEKTAIKILNLINIGLPFEGFTIWKTRYDAEANIVLGQDYIIALLNVFDENNDFNGRSVYYDLKKKEFFSQNNSVEPLFYQIPAKSLTDGRDFYNFKIQLENMNLIDRKKEYSGLGKELYESYENASLQIQRCEVRYFEITGTEEELKIYLESI